MTLATRSSDEELSRIAHLIRIRTIETSARAKIPHLGSCLSCIELLTTLYWSELKIDPKSPDSPNRDKFVLSKGHGAPVLFQVLVKRFLLDRRFISFWRCGKCFSRASSKTWLHPRSGSCNRIARAWIPMHRYGHSSKNQKKSTE